MLRKIATILFSIVLLPAFLSAQETSVITPGGKIYINKGELKNSDVRKPEKGKAITSDTYKSMTSNRLNSSNSLLGTIDTLIYPPPYGAWFSQGGQDWQVMWFEAPADLDLLQVGFACYANDDALTAEVKVVSFNWTKEEILNNTSAGYVGYYEATGNGFNDITGFLDNTDITGGWTSIDPFTSEIFGNDIWSDAGVGFDVVPIPVTTEPTYQWVDLSVGGAIPVPQLVQGELFGIAIRHKYTTMDDLTFGFWYAPDLGVPLFKFYANGRLDPGVDIGWWVRPAFSLLFAAEVDLTGDRAPAISDVTSLGTTLSSASRTVTATITDDNPSGGAAGVATALLQYSIDGGAFNDVTMTDMGGDVYSGDIPGQAAGTDIAYRVGATDVNSNASESQTFSYSIFEKMTDLLFIYNTSDFGQGTASALYLSTWTAAPIAHDYWDTGDDGVAEMDALLALYDAVLEVGGSFPDADISGNIATWIATGTAGDPKAYMLSSQDYGCMITGDCSDTTFLAGSFQYDYLGVETLGPQDISVDPDVQIMGVDADPLSGWVNQYAADSSVNFWYNSTFELGFTNFIDAIVPTAGATTIFTAEVDTSTDGSSGVETWVSGVRNQGTGWYTSFLTYDYAATDFLSDTSLAIGDDPGYAWGITVVSQAIEFFNWTDIGVSVERENNLLPGEYSLDQNYPNPFNPSTTIKFSVPQQSNVVLKVYDILGSEVANLVNESLDAGNYTINFDASKFASGMYIYTLTTGSFTTSKKMMLMK